VNARWLTQTVTHAVALAIAACASSTPEPAAQPAGPTVAPATSQPLPAPTTEAAEAPDAHPYGGAGQQDEGQTEPASSEAASETEEHKPAPPPPTSGPTAPPSETLTVRGVVFMLDYQASAVKAAHQEKCSKNAEQDPAKLAECMKKEREGFRAGAMRFLKSPDGKVRWVVYRRQGETLKEIYAGRFEFTNETETSVTLKPKGGGSGARPLFRGRLEVTIGVPNTYRIVLDDPQYGELVYKARFGLEEP
jgi:hypothetical protein